MASGEAQTQRAVWRRADDWTGASSPADARAHDPVNGALLESEERFRLLADTAPVMVWMSGPDKLCTYFNKSWLDFTGRPAEHQTGNGWSEGVHPDDLQRCLRTYGQAFDARQPFRMEYRLRRYDGEYRWILDTGVARFESDGTFEGYIGSCIDVTEQKQVEEALSAREQSLRRTQAELRALAHRLLQAQELERRRIAREMHDDWTQRLAVLAIDAVKLERQFGAPEAARTLLHAMREQLVALSEDVHALSRQLHPSILEDVGLVEALRSECAGFARREGIAVAYHAGDVSDLPRDVALCVYRVAQEALRNVARHAAVKEASLSVDVADAKADARPPESRGPVPSGAQELVLCVRDWGAGFDASSVRHTPGLGLSSMLERAHLIEADLSIRSEPGQGTTVTLRVPLSECQP